MPPAKCSRPWLSLFPAGSPAAVSGDRPAAVPALARGLLALQAGYGQLPPASVIVPAERLAGNANCPPALESDLRTVGPALLADPAPPPYSPLGGTLLPANAALTQPDLATTLEVLRTEGVRGFYAGSFAQTFVDAADAAGGGLSRADLATAARNSPPGITAQTSAPTPPPACPSPPRPSKPCPPPPASWRSIKTAAPSSASPR